MKTGALRSLEGLRVAFTGFLSVTRAEAMQAARRAGAVVLSEAQFWKLTRKRPT